MKQIPLKEFFKNRSKSSFLLSPNNKKIAFLDNYEKRKNIHVMDVNTGDIEVITTQQKRNIGSYSWKNNDKLIYLQDNDGDENHHLFVVDIKSKDVFDITPGEKVKVAGYSGLNDSVYLKGKDQWKNKLFIGHNERDGSVFDLYMYDIETKEREVIQEMKPGLSTAMSDEDTLKPTYFSAVVPGKTIFLDSDAKPLLEVSSKDSFSILEYTSKAKNELYVLSNINTDKIGLYKADLKLNIIGDVIFENDNVDILSAKSNYFTYELEYLSFEEEKRERKYFSKKIETLHKDLIKKLIDKYPKEKDSVVIPLPVLGTDNKIIEYYTYSDKKLGDEYIYFSESDKFIKLTESEEWLIPANLTDMKPIVYKARDGLTIHGYLTLPKNVNGPVPIIVNPHGGPWVRDSWGYNPEVQFFANRGYGIFQPNFRISTGYGKEHFTKGWHQWGKACQDDVTDGTQWLIDQGYTKPGMISIYGGSYGGYATLMGIIREPDLYSAAVDYVGVSDLFSFWDGFPDYWKTPGNIFEEALGNPHDDPEAAKEVSPVYHVDKIKTPLFVVQGAKDPRVPQKQADLIVEGLKKRNVPVKYMLKEDEGHGFANQENRFELYEQMLEFFENHLKR